MNSGEVLYISISLLLSWEIIIINMSIIITIIIIIIINNPLNLSGLYLCYEVHILCDLSALCDVMVNING